MTLFNTYLLVVHKRTERMYVLSINVIHYALQQCYTTTVCIVQT
jgi:hypothetical protein